MTILKFEDIFAWQKAQNLAVEIYKNLGNIKDYGFKDQICRAVVSISNNIAEGFDRSSNAEFVRFLYISLASCSEVKSMLYLSEKLNYTTNEQSKILLVQTSEVHKMTRGLIAYIKNQQK
ncbi:MAG: four helix bundle protein [Dysgonamonadaceae bacterium]|jgi:four helix bundle protein|nr:four helix bundle protein [Dysgonamonadaceae bacterium]